MRTTLNIDDDILQAVKELSRRQKKSAGEVLSMLARRTLTGDTGKPVVKESKAFYGFRPLPRVPGQIVTNEMIDKLREEDVY